MKKILISWMASIHDFTKDENPKRFAPAGSNANCNRYYYQKEGYEKHIILATKNSETQAAILKNGLQHTFPTHCFEIVLIDLKDIIDIELITQKVRPILLQYANYQIDIYMSPGTAAMSIAWVILHLNLNLNTHPFQLRPKQYSPNRNLPQKMPLSLFMNTVSILAEKKQLLLFKQQDQQRQLQQKKASIFTQYLGEYLYTDSIKPIYKNAYHIAKTDKVGVLILGESGTGKDHLARYIHHYSPRKKHGKFIAVNCSAFTDQLLASELFGYKKGAFTGANTNRKGLFEAANGGTLFLDEIGDISPYMQQSLLRVLQNGELSPLGSTETIKVDVRIIAATNKNLEALCAQGKFRWDLYYRLAVIDLELPSLYERGRKELELLLNFFIRSTKQKFNAPNILQFGQAARQLVLSYPFRGNIRELQNLVERCYVLCQNQTVAIHHLPKHIRQGTETHQYSTHPPDHTIPLREIEKQHIIKVYEHFNGNMSKTCQALAIASNTLRKKLKDYGMK